MGSKKFFLDPCLLQKLEKAEIYEFVRQLVIQTTAFLSTIQMQEPNEALQLIIYELNLIYHDVNSICKTVYEVNETQRQNIYVNIKDITLVVAQLKDPTMALCHFDLTMDSLAKVERSKQAY